MSILSTLQSMVSFATSPINYVTSRFARAVRRTLTSAARNVGASLLQYSHELSKSNKGVKTFGYADDVTQYWLMLNRVKEMKNLNPLLEIPYGMMSEADISRPRKYRVLVTADVIQDGRLVHRGKNYSFYTDDITNKEALINEFQNFMVNREKQYELQLRGIQILAVIHNKNLEY